MYILKYILIMLINLVYYIFLKKRKKTRWYFLANSGKKIYVKSENVIILDFLFLILKYEEGNVIV